MFLYQKVFNASCYLIALFIIANLSAPLYPHSLLTLILLVGASIFLFIKGIKFNLQKKRICAMFILATSLMSIVFLLEYQYILTQSDNINAQVFQNNVHYAIVIYNIFRFLLLIASALILLKELVYAIKHFGSEE